MACGNGCEDCKCDFVGKIGFTTGEQGFVFFDEYGVPIGMFSTRTEAVEASEEYFAALAVQRKTVRPKEDDDWLTGSPSQCTDEVCESCQ